MCDEETWHLYLLSLLPPVILLWVMRKRKRHCQQKQPVQCLLHHNLFSKLMSISHFVHLLFLSQVENHLSRAWKLRYEFVLLVSITLLRCDTPKYAYKQADGNLACDQCPLLKSKRQQRQSGFICYSAKVMYAHLGYQCHMWRPQGDGALNTRQVTALWIS